MKFFYNASAMQRAFGTLMLSLARAMQKFRSNTTKTLILGVKLAAVFILTACLQVSAKTTNAQKLSLSFKNGSLEKLFAEIEKKTNYVFFYDVAILKGTRPVTVEVKDASVEDILATSLKGQMLEYSIHDRTIFVKKGEKTVSLAPGGPGKGLPAAVTGTVRSESGTPLVGASVNILKLKKSGMTDENGEFVLRDVPNGEYEVEISFVGYETKKTTIIVENHEARVVADLKQSLSQLDETVVKGYYTTTNRFNTGNVTKVKGEDIAKQPVSDPIMALEGRVPGLYIQQASGIPGAGTIVRLRGQNSIANGNDPLYIVDGVPVTSTSITNPNLGGGAVGGPGTTGQNLGQGMSPFNSLNPADIESIEVLKDADATAIYGSRGANGVILITTKKGKKGPTRYDVNVYSGAGHVAREMKLLNTQQYLAMRHQALSNDGVSIGSKDYDLNGTWDSTRYTNWQKELIGRTSRFTNAQASVSGGSGNTQFVFGGGYSNQTTVYPGDFNDKKASLHFSLSSGSNNGKFHTVLSAQYVNDNNLLPISDFTPSALMLAPDAPALYDANGNINWQGGTWTNPVAASLEKAKAMTNNLIGNLNMGYEIISGLQLRGSFGYTRIEMNQDIQEPATSSYGPPSAFSRVHQVANNYINTWIIEPQLSYNKKVGLGKLDILIGSTNQQNVQNSVGILGYNFATDAQIPNIAAASTIRINGNYNTEYHYAAIYGRIGFNWQDKYLLNVTARRDGSSRFGPGNQFGNFGSIGAGWIFSKEHFIEKTLPFLSFGKLRASYGSTGNDQIAPYKYLNSYNFYTSSTYQGVTTIYPTILANPYFGWEQVKKLEAGIELGFLNDRVLLTASYYRNRTGNQLVGQPLPSVTGFTTITANLPGVVQNAGGEFTINTINVKGKDFSWTSSFNLTIPRNKLIAFPGLATNPSYSNTLAVGKSIYTIKSLHFTGLNPQTGVYTFEDVNHDNALSYPADYQFLKQVTQTYYGGFQNSFIYKGWQFDLFIQFVKQTGRNYTNFFVVPGFFNQNQPTVVLNSWNKPGDNSVVQQYTQNGASSASNAFGNYIGSDGAISDASFVRLKNLSLSYQLAGRLGHRMNVQNARLYIQGQNLLTFTKYLGLDPETQGTNLPPLRMVTGGIQISL